MAEEPETGPTWNYLKDCLETGKKQGKDLKKKHKKKIKKWFRRGKKNEKRKD